MSDLYFVEIIYNTDPEGTPVDDNDDTNRTLHGPFDSEDDAHMWLDTRTDGDKDVRDVIVGVLNKADPARPYVNALPGEPEPRASGACRHCGRAIVLERGRWIDPEARGDDRIWREICDSNHTERAAPHELGEENDHGPVPTTWFGRGTWATCKCGYDPHDNGALNQHWAEHGFKVVDHHGQLRKEPI